ncbi:hypothetical protein IRT45_14145 [Nocardia sp. BSTN01]|uniref:hypothetical protein n=1 Tax=Nocardia sp. BSTN01 TaxID=2783665 RepID=UPI00188F6C01|nr:hypothetical protein [Nocardia sp. BSTN01]MBF4998293.1 hypothetical protein [Nocardia sp. BSTN01]
MDPARPGRRQLLTLIAAVTAAALTGTPGGQGDRVPTPCAHDHRAYHLRSFAFFDGGMGGAVAALLTQHGADLVLTTGTGNASPAPRTQRADMDETWS